MKNTLLIIATCFFIACGPSREERAVQESEYKIIKIGNCTYVQPKYGSLIVHAGDCQNPIHLTRKAK